MLEMLDRITTVLLVLMGIAIIGGMAWYLATRDILIPDLILGAGLVFGVLGLVLEGYRLWRLRKRP